MIHKSVITDFTPEEYFPEIDVTAFIHPLAIVIGNATIGRRVLVSPFASIRGDEGQPLYIGNESNVQDGVIIHGLETYRDHLPPGHPKGNPSMPQVVIVDGKKYSVFIGDRVSLAHQVQIHGPAFVDNDSFIGMKSLVFKAKVGTHCVIEPGCILMGVEIPDGRYVPAMTAVTDQKAADSMPEITEEYALKNLNKEVVHVNTSLADGYNKIEIK